MQKETPTIKVTLELVPHGVKSIRVSAETAEARAEAVERLRRCLPQLELLEAALQETDVPTVDAGEF